MYLLTQVAPQVMGQAHLSLLAICGTATACGIHRFVNCINDLRHVYLTAHAAKSIATAGASHTAHQSMAAQLGEQLLQIGQRNILPTRNVGQANGAFQTMQRKIELR